MVKPVLRHGVAEIDGVFLHAVGEFGGGFEHFEDLERSGDDRWRDGVGKQVGPRTLAEQIDDFLFARGITTGCAAEGFAEGACC
jgi:hypothetical protein